jgi:hypothetical protein
MIRNNMHEHLLDKKAVALPHYLEDWCRRKRTNLCVAGKGISRPIFFSDLAESRTNFRFFALRFALSGFTAARRLAIVK